MLSGGSCRAGLCSGHHTFSLFYGLSDSLKPCYQNSKYIFIFKSLTGSINSLRVFPVHGQTGGFVFTASKEQCAFPRAVLGWGCNVLLAEHPFPICLWSHLPLLPVPSSPHASTTSHAGFCTEQLPPVGMFQFPSPKFSCFSSYFPSTPAFPPMN